MSLLLSLGPWVLALAALVVCSAFFSSSESAIFSLPESSDADAGDEGAVENGSAATLVLVFGEIVPKSYGLGRNRSWSLRVARPIAAVEFVLSPLVFVFDRVTRRFTALVGGDPDIEDPYLDSDGGS